MSGDPYAVDRRAKLRVPKGALQQLVRQLAEVAMSVTHHDASETEIGYIYEVQAMERRFTNILRGKTALSVTKGE